MVEGRKTVGHIEDKYRKRLNKHFIVVVLDFII